MELKDFLEIGAQKAGSLTALGKLLDMSQPHISRSKSQKRPMPLDAAVKLADYIGADLRAVIAANELVSEKKEEKRRFWSPFVEHARAATFALALTSVCGTSFVSPTPAEAAPLLNDVQIRFVLCQILFSKKRHLQRSLELFFKSFLAFFASRPLEVQAI